MNNATASAGTGLSTIAVVGAGSVGATYAYAALINGVARRVVLYDVNGAKVRAEALDLAHGIEYMPMGSVDGSDEVGICAGADLVVVTAGAKQRPGQSRMELAERTVGLMRTLLPDLVEVAPDAIYLMVTNPVDVVTYAAQQISGLPARRVLGSGTVLDSSRLRYLVAGACGVAVRNVHAYVLGEHGDSEVPIWSSATIGGVPVREFSELGATVRDGIAREVVESAYRIIEGKGATNYAIGLAATRISQAILRGEGAVLPVSSRLRDYRGISDVCLSVPSVVDRTGVARQLEIPLDAAEVAALQASAASVRATARRCGF
ncbi:L-lactate dehydrogenase [Ruania alkalisoli]|uniref:L-lactate dehydrogenase n=1 Tax=Ruania alkalisoli TaxID=2779775 RepID=A0A7M1SX25_9MICO|nr:L-lactate dehydrogenase [Ruania alkalisoli]QOR72128.1 L-lactate dehydrogenase [Ruania alkalisoli]